MPKEKCCSNIPEAVGGDEDGEEAVHPVDRRLLGLCDLDDDEADEADVGEGCVDCSVQGNPPLLAEPWGGGRLLALRGEQARVEERVEEEKQVTWHLREELGS